MLDKIKKLLRLGSSSNQHEAEAALARAYELAQKHHINLSSIDLDKETIEHARVRHGMRLSYDREKILALIASFFRVQVVLSAPDAVFIGRSTDLMIAQYAYAFLLHRLRADLQAYAQHKRRTISKNQREVYILGWIYGVGKKLDETQQQMEMEDSRFALVTTDVDPAVKAAEAAMFPNTEERQSRNPARKDTRAMVAGFASGQNVNVRQPLSGPAVPALTR